MKKKILSLILALSLGFILPAAAAGFADVADNDWFADAVNWAVERKITSGTSATAFSPNSICTRGEIITLLWRFAGSPAPAVSGSVSDINADDYFYQAVLWAKGQNMFDGNAFRPNEACTRLMAVEFMWKEAGAPAAKSSITFKDVDCDAVHWAIKQQLTAGIGTGKFGPDQTCTRAQIVKFLYQDFYNNRITGTYIREDGRYRLELKHDSSWEIALYYTQEFLDSIEDPYADPNEKILYGGLKGSGVGKWWSIGTGKQMMNLELVGDDLVMSFTENGQPVDNNRSGRYIREK